MPEKASQSKLSSLPDFASPHEEFILVHKTEMILHDIDLDIKAFADPYRTNVQEIIGSRAFERDMRFGLDPMEFNEPLQIDKNIGNYYEALRGPEYVLSPGMLEPLEQSGHKILYLVDIGRLYRANIIPTKLLNQSGDFLMRDILSNLGKDYGKNFHILRWAGDEFCLVEKLRIIDEEIVQVGDIENTAKRAFGLYLKHPKNAAFDPAAVTVHKEYISNILEKNKESILDIDERIKRLTSLHPELEEIKTAFDTIQDLEQKKKFVYLFEALFFDKLLQNESEVVSSETGKIIHAYKDIMDFFTHLRRTNKTYQLLKIDVPATLKIINDNKTLGYRKGSEFLISEYGSIARVAADYLDDVRMIRRGGNYYLAVPDTSTEKIPELADALRDNVSGRYSISQDVSIPMITGIVAYPLNFEELEEDLEQQKGQDYKVNRMFFYQIHKEISEPIWNENFFRISHYFLQKENKISQQMADTLQIDGLFLRDEDIQDFAFLADLLNPYNTKRDLLERMDLNPLENGALRSCYVQENEKWVLNRQKLDVFVKVSLDAFRKKLQEIES
ncbi:MAG TPA: hypothetical protein VLG12_01990 [Candidatus Saccharimonadales bacterium]|nr:hypothetical protein [Candidatus Saccharimonadales bacterium]